MTVGKGKWCLAAIVVVAAWLPVAASFADNGKIAVIDDIGQMVSLARPAKRIVSLSPHITELLFEAGAGSSIVGAVDYSDYPQAAKQLLRVGSANRLDVETILSLRPDLIVAWHSGNTVQDLQMISRFGIPIFYSEPRSLDQIASNLSRLGILTGYQEKADRKARIFRQRLRLLDDSYRHRKKLAVFFQLWDQPLMTINGKHILNDVMDLCGARNIFADLSSLTPTVSREAVIQQKPYAIVATDVSLERLKLEWKDYTRIPAVQADNYFVLSADLLHRQGPRLLEGARQLCLAIEKARQRQS